MNTTVGKLRGLAQCATRRGTFAMLALDHRGNLRRALNPENSDSVSFEQMVAFKKEVTRSLAPYTSGILLDPEIGGAPAIASGALPGHVGLLMAVEATGYAGDTTERRSRVLPGWSVGKIRRMGASGVKLLLYYHPDAAEARAQEELVREVAETCRFYDLPLFLEPLSFSIDPAQPKLTSDQKRSVVIQTAKNLTPLGIDVLKAEFPLDVRSSTDETLWKEACEELDAASHVPWILLSAGVEFETYLRQVQAACRAGASGVLAGRAIWKEAADLSGQARMDFLTCTAAERMQRITALCDALAKPWTALIPAGAVEENWHLHYQDLR
ncbi:MAG: tagatose 1,6-diphosphate aldolase [Anaerolineales bacterium]|nr:tagatose 1,6-diphosphate aldolase [Anaerolineales bacterium]